MCRAVPYQVVRVAGGRAEILIGGRLSWVSTQALPDLAPGDYVIVYADHAVERVDAEDAQALLRALAELDHLLALDDVADHEVGDDH
jgi:hydrogenase assembly chaperone HypC/HupF